MCVFVCVANRYSINSKLLHSANANYFPASGKRNHHHHHRDHVPFAITAAVQIIMQRQFVKCAEINTVNYTYPAARALCVCVCSGCCCVNEMRRLPNTAKTHSDIAADNLTNTLTLDLHLRARERETEKKSRKKTRSLEEAQFIHKNFQPSRPNSVCPSAFAAIGGLPILSNPLSDVVWLYLFISVVPMSAQFVFVFLLLWWRGGGRRFFGGVRMFAWG